MSTTYCLQGGLQAPAAARRLLLRGRTWDTRLHDTIALMLSEVVTNAVLHGGIGPEAELLIGMAVNDGVVRFQVYDRGQGFTVPALERPHRQGGWGLFIVDRLAHRWGVTAARGGTCVWFEALLDGAT